MKTICNQYSESIAYQEVIWPGLGEPESAAAQLRLPQNRNIESLIVRDLQRQANKLSENSFSLSKLKN